MKNIHYINAGAGSGKTFTLTETLVGLIKDGKCRPSEVILTTFTELAASEFRQKAYDALVKAGRYDEAAELDSATIGTVHSVALKYVQKYWYLLGLGSKMNVLSEEDKKIFISTTVGGAIGADERLVLKEFDDTFSKYGYRNDEKWIEVLTKILNESQTFRVDSLEESKKYSLAYIDGFFSEEPIELPMDKVRAVAKTYQKVCASEPEKTTYLNALMEVKDVVSRLDSYPGLSKLYSLLKKPVGGKKTADLPGFAEVTLLLEKALRSSALKVPLLKACETMFDLAIKVDKAFTEFKAKRGLIEYNDMEKFFIELLDKDIVKEDIRSSVKYVFVDEFQDSNPTQIEIFDKLSELVKQSYWVGDPKQSIYAFRGSAPEVVMDVTSKIYAGGSGFSHDDLPYSWRSGKNLVDFDSAVASKLFTDSKRYPKPALQHAPKGNQFNAEHAVIHWDSVDGLDPHALGQKIIQVLNETDLQPKDIAVLIRKNDDVVEVASQLRMNGLPVSSPEVFLPMKAETQLLFALLKFTVLRDSHTKAELSSLILDKRLPEIIAHKDEILAAFDALRFEEILERVKHQSVPDIVDTIIDEMDLRGLCSKWGDGTNRQVNLDTLQAQAREYDNHCIQMGLGSSINGYIEYVAGLQIPPKADNSDNGVKVLTYHGAKGLEWRMVIMYSLWADPILTNMMRTRFVFGYQIEKSEGKRVLRYIPDFRATDKSGIPDFILNRPEVAAGIEAYTKREQEECKRLLYVGFTRAKDYLVTLGVPGKKYKWLSAAGLEPGQICNLEERLQPIWDPNVPKVMSQQIVGTTRMLYRAESDTCTWYKPVVDIPQRPAKIVTPSKQESTVTSKKTNIFDVAAPICVAGKYDPAELGTCIHNYFAVHSDDMSWNIDAAKRLVNNFKLSANIPEPKQMADSAALLFRWFEVKIGRIVGMHRELPFNHKLANGQTVVGEIDLVVEFDNKHCALVDYKNTHLQTDYGPQLSVYKNALEAGVYIVDRMFIYYALQGKLAEIEIL